MASSSGFFGQRNPQAVLKHGVLTRYAHYFAGRAGSVTGGRVAFIDGYAGEGRYADENPGSPLLLATQAERAKTFGRSVRLAFVESDDSRRARLQSSLAEAGVQVDQLLAGDFEETIDGLIDRYDDRATFLFVDPFGLAFSREALERVLSRRTARRPIDVLYHFSLSTVYRMGRAGVRAGSPDESLAEALDAALGSVGWRELFRGADRHSEPTSAALELARRFGKSVADSTGVPAISIPVRQRPGHLPKYLLMLFSANRQARWDYVDQAGMAYGDWLHHCSQSDYDANIRHQDDAGVLSLFPAPEPERSDAEDEIERMAREYLPGHLSKLLAERGSFRPADAIEDAYGEMFGVARAKHIRTAIKELHKAGRIVDDGTLDFWDRELR